MKTSSERTMDALPDPFMDDLNRWNRFRKRQFPGTWDSRHMGGAPDPSFGARVRYEAIRRRLSSRLYGCGRTGWRNTAVSRGPTTGHGGPDVCGYG